MTAAVVSDASCNDNNGEATATAAGGTAPYTYIWSNGVQETVYGNSTITGLVAGAYQVTVRDANGCEAVDGVMIRDLGGLTAIVDMHTDVSCNGGSDGAISITVTGGTGPGTYIYDWDSYNNGGYASTDEDIMDIPAGLYEVVIYDGNGCRAELKNIEITEPDVLLVEEVDNQDVTCHGYSDGSVTVNATGGTSPYRYDWLTIAGADNGPVQNLLTAGSYTIVVTDANGCVVTTVVTVLEPTKLTAMVPATMDVTCYGGNDGTATVSAIGRHGAVPVSVELRLDGQDGHGLDQPVSYTVLVMDANGCTTTVEGVVINEPATPVQVTIDKLTDPSCEGDVDGTLRATATGGSGGWTYLWSNGQTLAEIGGLSAGTYSVIARDAKGCEATATMVLTDPKGLSASVAGLHGCDLLRRQRRDGDDSGERRHSDLYLPMVSQRGRPDDSHRDRLACRTAYGGSDRCQQLQGAGTGDDRSAHGSDCHNGGGERGAM